MSISENLETFLGKPVIDWEEGKAIEDPESAVFRLRHDEYEAKEEVWLKFFDSFLEDPKVSQLEALVLGAWPSAYDTSTKHIVDKLVASADRLINLKALFFGDITGEECEVSWIIQSDMTPLLDAYPKLEHLTVRGGTQLQFSSPLKHYNLKTLIVQTGGLSKTVIEEICKSELPELKHLELWLGVDDYGGDHSLEDLKPILEGDLFPKLKTLGLCNSKYQNAIAEAIVESSILSQLKVLNLSMGVLTDKGAEALLECKKIKKLKKLDLHHHYCSDKMMRKLEKLGIEVNLEEQQEGSEDDEYSYYVSVSE